MSEREPIIGIKVIGPVHPDNEVHFEKEAIGQDTLTDMTRRRLRPILTMNEIERRGRNYVTVGGFAVAAIETEK